MTSLSKIENNDGLEFHIDTDSGLAYCSISAAARMLETPRKTVDNAVKPWRENELISAEIQTTQGLRRGVLLSSSQVFKLALKYNKDWHDSLN